MDYGWWYARMLIYRLAKYFKYVCEVTPQFIFQYLTLWYISMSASSMHAWRILVQTIVQDGYYTCAGSAKDQGSPDEQGQRVGRLPAARRHSKLLPYDPFQHGVDHGRHWPAARRDCRVRRAGLAYTTVSSSSSNNGGVTINSIVTSSLTSLRILMFFVV